eukprot:COSAG04_NODE_1607_length_6175_cov_6.046906_2_plen_307_part_00
METWDGGRSEWEDASASGSGGGDTPPHEWPWPWGALGLNPFLTLALSLLSMLSEGLYGATSFGPAITFNVGWQVCYMLGLSDGTLTSVARDMTVMESASAALQILLLRKLVDPRLALAISLPCVITTYLGQLLMIQLDGPLLKLSLGVILLGMTAQRVAANCGASAPKADRPDPVGLDLRRPRTLLSILFWFGTAGLMVSHPAPAAVFEPAADVGLRGSVQGGVTGIGGPPMMLFVSIHQVPTPGNINVNLGFFTRRFSTVLDRFSGSWRRFPESWRQDGGNGEKTGEKRAKMGEKWPKKSGGKLT